MRLIPEWRWVMTRAHSMWGSYLAVLFLAVPELLYWLAGIDTAPRAWWLLGMAAALYAVVGRVIDQHDDDGTGPLIPLGSIALMALIMFLTMGMASWVEGDGQEPPGLEDVQGPPSDAAVLAVALPLVTKWEGVSLVAYLDRIAVPPVWTACHGETDGVQPGDTYTAEECAAMLAKRLPEYGHGWYGYLTPVTLSQRLTAERAAAFWSFSYNVGIAGAGKSTATRRLNAGEIRGACEAIGWWNKAGDRVIRGLVNRRAEETALCLKGAA